jgi:hypothetical protein
VEVVVRTKVLHTFSLGVAISVIGCASGEDAVFAPLVGSGGATGTVTTSVITPGTTAVPSAGGSSSKATSSPTGGVATTPSEPATTPATTSTGGAFSWPGWGKSTQATTTAGGGKATGTTATGGAGTAGAASTAAVNCSGPALTGGTTYSSDGSGNVAGGYHYELWHDGGGSMKMTVFGVGAAFKAEWNNAGDFLARVGLKWDSTKTHDQYGTISADYAFTKTGSGGGYSFIGIYGWTKSPLIEYYIVEDWFGNGPPTGGGEKVGSFDVDGGTYNIYKFQRVSKPSIEGTSTFWQFFSVRQKARQCGHISISEHFKKWGSLSLTLGKMYEAKILVEAGGGSGSFDLTSATMTAVK